MYRFVLAAVLSLSAAPAIAEWSYDSPSDGRAVGPGTEGVSLAVECGNGGIPAFFVEGFEPPEGMVPMFVIGIDGDDELYPSECSGASCMLMPETVEEAFGLVSDLRAGVTLDIGLYRGGPLSIVPLDGSSDAIGSLAGQGCRIS